MRLLPCVVAISCAVSPCVDGAGVQLVSSSKLEGPARYGLGKLREAIASRGLQVETLERVEDASAPSVSTCGPKACPTR